MITRRAFYNTINYTSSFFNGARHFYRPLAGDATSWKNEWLMGPGQHGTTTFLSDADVTPKGELVVSINYSSGAGVKERKTLMLTSKTGAGDWKTNLFLPYENTSGCFERTSDEALNFFYNTAGAFLGYARSADGVTWSYARIIQPSAIRRTITSVDCIADDNGPLPSNPAAIVTGVTNTQTIDYSKLPKVYFPQGHSVIFVEIPNK